MKQNIPVFDTAKPGSKRIASYKDIPTLLREKKEFTGNSMSAKWEKGEPKDLPTLMITDWRRAVIEGPIYVVYSYATAIAVHVPGLGTKISGHKFSTTTSRHQNLCKAHLGDHIV